MCEQLMLSFYNVGCRYFLFFFKQKTAYELLISDWSSDVCSSDLITSGGATPSNRAANSTTSFCGAGMSSARLYAPLGPSKAAITPLAISSTWMRLNTCPGATTRCALPAPTRSSGSRPGPEHPGNRNRPPPTPHPTPYAPAPQP